MKLVFVVEDNEIIPYASDRVPPNSEIFDPEQYELLIDKESLNGDMKVGMSLGESLRSLKFVKKS